MLIAANRKDDFMKGLLLTLVIALLSIPAFAESGCTRQDISLGQYKIRAEYGWFIIVGDLTNNCSEPTGVELRVTLYGADNAVLDTNNFWPASMSNIPPKSRYPVKTMLTYQDGIKRFDVRVESVRRW